MSNEWSEIRVQDACNTLRSKRRKLLARDYGTRGRFPIVDQGQEAIAGWSDDESLVVSDELPLIVFGDHTRTFKYIDQPFIVGADGTQLLKPNKNIDPLFFYFACRNLDIPSRGYNRHFTILKEKTIRYPDLPLQRKIAAVLRKIQQAIEVETNLIRVTRELKAAVMKKLFTEGLYGEAQKETEIGMVPESWDLRAIQDLREFLQYGTSEKCHLTESGVPVLRIPNVIGGEINVSELKYLEASSRSIESYSLATGDVLFVRTNGQRAFVGRCAVYDGTPESALFASYLIRARINASLVMPHFLQLFSETENGQAQLSGRAHSAADGKFNINTKTIDSVIVPIPSLDEQHSIVAIIESLKSMLAAHEKKLIRLHELFQTTLSLLMSGNLPVTNLKIDTTHFESPGVAA